MFLTLPTLGNRALDLLDDLGLDLRRRGTGLVDA